MLTPKKVKYRKWQTGRENQKKVGNETRGTYLSFGGTGLKAMTAGRIRSQEIEAARRAASHNLGKTGKLWTRIFPDRPYTQKPAEVKMGKGKGDLQGYEAAIRPGRVLFEVDGVTDVVAAEAMRKAGAKLSIRTKVVTRHIK
ncbi:MAG: 50S ribosomal protein L16 [Minisyncoccia bacterium]